MTGFAIAEYLIVVLEVFLICDVSARGLKPEMVERKESLIYLCASVGMNVFFRCLGKAGVSAAEIFIFKSGILALLLWAVRRVSVWRAFLVFGCFQVLEELSRTWIVLLFCNRSRVCRRWDGQHTGIEYQQDHGLYSGIEDL